MAKEETKDSSGPKEKSYPVWVRVALGIFQCWLYVYDCIAYLPFLVFANPEDKLARSRRQKAKPIEAAKPNSPWRNVDCDKGQLKERIYEDCDTLAKQWQRAVTYYSVAPCLGTREIKSVEQEKQKSGKTFEKYQMGKYDWQSYQDVSLRVEAVGSGLAARGVKKGDRVVVFSETRAEWMITALACFEFGYTVVTVYATLGAEAIEHAVNQSNATVIVTSAELVPRVVAAFPKTNKVKRCVYFPSRTPAPTKVDVNSNDLTVDGHELELETLADLESLGKKQANTPTGPVRSEDTAVIMYTSGTTGLPKGVLISHANLIAAGAGQTSVIPGLGFGDVYIGYLPLAHVLELGAELGCLAHGVCVGYSSPTTLHDQATKIKRGTKGDASALRPTLMAAVPAIMDRISKAVLEKVNASPPFRQALFHFLYQRKRAKIEHGYDNPFLNRLVFSHIREILGGRVRLMLSGGAPLNAETERFMNICFCCPVGQGYGLTETCGAGTIKSADSLLTGVVGAPLVCNDLLLRDWDEANYRATNRPHPQGEILLSGANVVKGYLDEPEKTEESFIELEGRRWFATGDIGEVLPDGNIKIIDRKKDLVKLSHGEYIALGKVETALLTSSLVEMICVHGDSAHGSVVALVCPNKKALSKLAENAGAKATDDMDAMCKDPKVAEAALSELGSQAKKAHLEKFEVPSAVHLCPEAWTPDSGLLTEALKLRRKQIADKYRQEIDKMYKK